MRRLLPLLLIASLAAAGVAAWLWYPWPQPPWDGQPNHYRIAIDAKTRTATIDAEIWLGSDMLSMYNIAPVPDLPGGQVDLVDGLSVTTMDGKALSLRDLGLGDYSLDGGRRVRLHYTIRMEHDRHPWPAGTEEVAYWTDEGLMTTGATLMFADGGERMEGPITVEFDLPEGWTAHTPWTRSGDGQRFDVPSRRELLSNALFLGTAPAQTVEIDGLQLTLVLGSRYRQNVRQFTDLLQTQLQSYVELFGGPPRAARYLIIVNDNPTGDGGAFASSFSQFIDGDADERNRVIWGYVMAHELLHFWNGLSITPADDREEWFKEGATDYLTIVTLARNGLLDREMLFKRLENVPRRYLIARMAQRLGMSVREAGRDKQPNRLLVYGGGSLAALALDVELRLRSDDRVGLPQLLQQMQREFGETGTRYELADIERIARDLTGHDFSGFFADAVDSQGWFDIRPAYQALGLRMDSFVEEMFISHEPRATAEQRARFAAIFGDGAAWKDDATGLPDASVAGVAMP